MSCNKRTAWSGCPAVEGDHENLAILGHFAGSATECVATHPSGRLAAVVHHVVEQTAIRTEFAEQTAACSRVMYASSALRTTAPTGAARRAGEVRVPRLLGVFAASGSSTRCWRGPSSSAA